MITFLLFAIIVLLTIGVTLPMTTKIKAIYNVVIWVLVVLYALFLFVIK
jgi:hypothetical protein